jgi:hypothetical protein
MKNTALRKLSLVSYRLRQVLTRTLFLVVAVSDMLLLRLIVLCLEDPVASS